MAGKRGAPRGNKNAKGRGGGKKKQNYDKGFVSGAVPGFLAGPIGSGLGGVYGGATKSKKGMKTQRRTAGVLGAAGGAVAGTRCAPRT